MTWLVTGGAGYIGAHVVRAMHDVGERVIVVDDLSTGRSERVPSECLVVSAIHDAALVREVMAAHSVTGILHFAAKKQVAESVDLPLLYYRENVEGLRILLDCAVKSNVKNFVFSSSAAVYGMPEDEYVTEDAPCHPASPYGETKLAGEWLVRATARAHGLRYANLRYFNVAGAGDPRLADTGPFNLVPMVFERLDAGLPPRVFGDDYPTPDGTCIRDFVHVVDIASAHRAVAQALASATLTSLTANIGRGVGSSVGEVMRIVADVTSNDRRWVEPTIEPRRPGDPARVVASIDTLRHALGWTARYDTRDMIESAWAGWKAMQ